jgi:hypothetical protein
MRYDSVIVGVCLLLGVVLTAQSAEQGLSRFLVPASAAAEKKEPAAPALRPSNKKARKGGAASAKAPALDKTPPADNSAPVKKAVAEKPLEKEPLFSTSSAPPPGFEGLSTLHSQFVDLYFQGQMVGVVQASVSETQFLFSHPGQVVGLIADRLKDTAPIQVVLQQELSPHSDLVCHGKQPQGCPLIAPEVAGVIYDPTSFKVALFVNERFYKPGAALGEQLLGDSTVGLSYLNNMSAVTTHVGGGLANNQYAIHSFQTVGYHNGRLETAMDYANNLMGDTRFAIDNAHWAWYHKAREYDAGMFNTIGNFFFVNQPIVGVQVKSTLATLINGSADSGVPISVPLNFPSQVSVYEEGRLIYTGQYPAGNQVIDTRNFPAGAYPIVIKITSAQGEQREINDFFIKGGGLAPLHHPQYYGSVGYLRGFRRFDTSVFTPILPIPVYQAGANVRMTNAMGLEAGLLGTGEVLYGSLGAHYVMNRWALNPSAVLGINGDLGYAGQLTYHRPSFSFNLLLSQMWYQDKSAVLTKQYQLLNMNALFLNARLSTSIAKTGLSVFASMRETPFHQRFYSQGLTAHRNLFHLGKNPVIADFSVGRTEQNVFLMAQLMVSFHHGEWAGAASAGYQATRHHEDKRLTQDDTMVSVSGDWAHERHHVGAHYMHHPLQSTVNGLYDYANDWFHMNVSSSYNYNVQAHEGFLVYGGMLRSSFYYGDSAHGIVSGDGNTGVVFSVESAPSDQVFDIYLGEKHVRQLQGGHSGFLPVAPFERYQFHVVGGTGFYSFKQPFRHTTLYPGNIDHIVWQAQPKYILSGRLIQEAGGAVANGVIKGGIELTTTNHLGYFQMETVLTGGPYLAGDGHIACQFKLPDLPTDRFVVYVGDVVCHPSKDSKEGG